METPPPIPENKLASLSPKSIGILMIGVFLLLTLMIAGFAYTHKQNSTNPTQNSTDNTSNKFLAPNTIVYATWANNSSTVMAYDLSTGKEYVLAQLPVTIKKVSILSPNTLLFINDTDIRDHGDEIATYDISTKKISTVIQASDGFGIDDYVLSPDKSKLADWEVQMNKDSGVLVGGKSRVYTASLGQTSAKNLIFDENADTSHPVHYPRGILDSGEVFMDTFLPNSGAGWAYGMSVADFDGNNKKDIDSMKNGTYSTHPLISNDGSTFVFAGYDGSKGPGADVRDGFRVALSSADTIELLNTSSLQRIKLTNIASSNTYGNPKWIDANNILVSVLAGNSLVQGDYIENIPNLTLQSADSAETGENSIVAPISNSLFLVGKPDTSDSATGNLGETYASSYYSFSLFDTSSHKTTPLSVTPSLSQFITVLPANYFSATLTKALPVNNPANNKLQLQLQTFLVKSELAPKRKALQSDPPVESHPTQKPTQAPNPGGGSTPQPPADPGPPIVHCDDLAAQQCKSQYPGDNSLCNDVESQQCQDYLKKKKTYDACISKAISDNKSIGACVTTPLYLYGVPGTKVTVTTYTQITQPNVEVTNNQFQVLLQSDGRFTQFGNIFSSVNYNYNPAVIKILPPSQGTVVTKDEVKQALELYATKLGLNQKETSDLVTAGLRSVTKPYAFISFYDDTTSKAILPITFQPKPDVYRNIVFYFKNLDKPLNYSLQPPKIDPISRHGFTAIEISEIVE